MFRLQAAAAELWAWRAPLRDRRSRAGSSGLGSRRTAGGEIVQSVGSTAGMYLPAPFGGLARMGAPGRSFRVVDTGDISNGG